MTRAMTFSLGALLLTACGGAPVPAVAPVSDPAASSAPVEMDEAGAVTPRSAEEAAFLKYRGTRCSSRGRRSTGAPPAAW